MGWRAYEIPELQWPMLLGRLARAEDRIARLDERVQKSEIRDGWRRRTDYLDVVSSLWVEGELIHLEDLVLHDANMDVRAPTHDITKAHGILRVRRRAGSSSKDWRNSASAVNELLGRRPLQTVENDSFTNAEASSFEPGDEIHSALSTIDEAVARSEILLSRTSFAGARIGEESTTDRIQSWLTVVEQTANLPPVLASVIAADAWSTIDPLDRDIGQGRLLAAALLRLRGKTSAHLTLWSIGARAIPRAERRHRNPLTRYAAGLDSLVAAADEGLRLHETWLTAKRILQRKVRGRRSTSHLPALIDLLIATPLLSAAMISSELRISQRAALDLIAELEVREFTGRGRFRAWGIT